MRSSGRIGPGASTILMILVVLVMTMLGVLSLFSARSDMEMSERTAVAAEEYYAAQTDFSLWLQETDQILVNLRAAAGGNGDDYAQLVFDQFGARVGEALSLIHILTGFLSYVLQVMNSLMMLSNVFLLLTRSLASAVRVSEVLDEKIAFTSPEDAVEEVPDGSVDFENVSFKYHEDAQEYALSGVTLHIPAGRTVGILGGTGSAKSTLVQLIPRLYEARCV